MSISPATGSMSSCERTAVLSQGSPSFAFKLSETSKCQEWHSGLCRGLQKARQGGLQVLGTLETLGMLGTEFAKEREVAMAVHLLEDVPVRPPSHGVLTPDHDLAVRPVHAVPLHNHLNRPHTSLTSTPTHRRLGG